MRDAPWTEDTLKVSISVSGENHCRSPLPGLSDVGSMPTDSLLIPMQSSLCEVGSAPFRPLAGFPLSLESSMLKFTARIFLLSWIPLDLILLHLLLLLHCHFQEGLWHHTHGRSPAIALFQFLYHLLCLPGLFTFVVLNRRSGCVGSLYLGLLHLSHCVTSCPWEEYLCLSLCPRPCIVPL
jgi:hypothetical protein